MMNGWDQEDDMKLHDPERWARSDWGDRYPKQAKEQQPDKVNIGWKCPNCGAGMAPWAMRCTCQDVNKGT